MLIKCKECEAQISDKSEKCIKCGAPIEMDNTKASVVGGIFMLIPGYVTDGIGVLLFIPGLRTIAGAWMLHQLVTNNRFKGFVHIDGQSGFSPRDSGPIHDAGDVIEGDVTEHTPPRDLLDKH